MSPLVTQLASDGEYAGNDAIVAFARAHSTNIVIHQHNASRWEVLAPASTQHTLHIAYLNGEHYCSVEPVISSDRLPPVAAKVSYSNIHMSAIAIFIFS